MRPWPRPKLRLKRKLPKTEEAPLRGLFPWYTQPLKAILNAKRKLSLRGVPASRQEATWQSHEIASLRPLHHEVQGFVAMTSCAC
jgi:hypothetical protein